MNQLNNKEVLNTIKNTVLNYLPEAKVLLFGSRARGQHNKDSDFDILVITKDDINPKEKMNMESRISKSLVYSIHAPFDVILHSRQDFELKKNLKGFIIYHALKDAIEL